MDAVEFLKERNRMCNFYTNGCKLCPAYKVKYCSTLCAEAIDMIPVVEQWAKEHPVKTRQSEMLKLFPEDSILYNKYLNICPAQISSEYRDEEGDGCYDLRMDCNKCKHDFWLKEIE